MKQDGKMSLMETLRANRKEPSRGQQSLIRSSTAGRETTSRTEGIKRLTMELKASEGTNMGTITTMMREATASANKTLKERGYEDLMDEHALQIFIVRNGMIIEETPEFQSFKRLASKRWAKLQPFLKLLLKCISKLSIKLIRINGSDLLKVALMHRHPAVPHVMSCLVAADDDAQVGENYLASLKHLSAIKIQTSVRMRQAKKLARRLRILARKIKIIQNWIRSWLIRRRFKNAKASRDERVWNNFEDLQNGFKDDWQEIKQVSRVEIHYAGFSGNELSRLGIDNLTGRTGSQIGRIFRAMQEKVEVIYVTSNEIPDEVKRYYYKMMELAGLKLGNRRVHFLTLDMFSNFPEHFSMAAKILYSKSTLREIRRVSFSYKDCEQTASILDSRSTSDRRH